MCKIHIQFVPATSIVEDKSYTFCEECENNIESCYDDSDDERLPMWRDTKLSK